ncbi:MAG: dihydrolipoamide acetyltransferase family protein [Caldilineaceae bacterium]|nr:dihydrolipoamide acetyltransferase family protein [Caldilineaceae bacterium]MDE0336267.1 dihydrolipoamide acetyltransferase family protein [Caldilineaceae bacterium]
MPKEVIMPALGMAQDVGVLLRWLKSEGEMVTAGEPLMEVATDKVDVQVEAPASGLLTAVTAQEGDEVPVGQVIGLIAAEGEEIPAAPAPPVAAEPEETPQAENGGSAPLPSSPVAARIAAEHGVDLADVQGTGGRISKEDVEAHIRSTGTGSRVLASPKARRLARERGLDLAALAGSGPEGAVLAADVPLAAQPAPEAPAPVVHAPAAVEPLTQPVSRMWQVMAERLTGSWTSVPHFYLVREVSAGQLIHWRETLAPGGSDGARITYTDLLTKLAALSLARFPRLNSYWDDGNIVTNPEINVGLAIAVEEGLLVPVVHSADRLHVEEIAARRADLVARAGSGGLTPNDFAGGTFTISNLGMFGVDAFNAIVNPPQAAILAVGRIADRVVAVDGQPAVRPMMTLTLSCDHRAVDGVRAAQFLDAFAGMIEEPLRAL